MKTTNNPACLPCLVCTSTVFRSMNGTLTRAQVSHAVDEYGHAWTTQNPDRIAQLFTESAIYVERPFDGTATMRGREAIREYWVTQVVGKQSNIRFRHCVEEMVLDTERNTAVVKWLAEFENIRHKMDITHKTVRFCQMAKLIFGPNGKQIEYLEEYAQGTSATRYNWPPLGISEDKTPDALLWDMVRNEPRAFASQGKCCECRLCSAKFESKSKLFVHLRSTKCGADSASGKTVNDAQYNPPSAGKYSRLVKLCVSCSYATKHVPIEEIELRLKERILEGIQQTFSYVEDVTITWAAPPRRAKHAAINVASFTIPEMMWLSVDGNCDVLMQKWNDGILETKRRRNNSTTSSSMHSSSSSSCCVRQDDVETSETSLNTTSLVKQAHIVDIVIRKCSKVDRSFAPLKMCEREKYEALIPLSMLSTEKDQVVDPLVLSSKLKSVVRQFSGDERSFHNFTTMKLGSGKKSTILQLGRVRSCGLLEGATNGLLLNEWMTITIPMKYHLPGIVSKIIGAIVSVMTGTMSLEQLKSAFDEDVIMDIPTYPSMFIYLISPNMTRYEQKVKIKATLSRSHDLAFGDIHLVRELGMKLVEWEKHDQLLLKESSSMHR